MHKAKDDKATPEQDSRTLSEKRADAAKRRWARQKAMEAGYKLLEDQAKEQAQKPLQTPAIPPPPATPAGWQEKIRERLWAALNQNDDRVLLALAKFLEFDTPQLTESDLNELENIRRIRAMTDAELAEYRAQLLAVINRPQTFDASRLPETVRLVEVAESEAPLIDRGPQGESPEINPQNRSEEPALSLDTPSAGGSEQAASAFQVSFEETLPGPKVEQSWKLLPKKPATATLPTVLPSGARVPTPEPAQPSPVTARPKSYLPSAATDPRESEISGLSDEISKR